LYCMGLDEGTSGKTPWRWHVLGNLAFPRVSQSLSERFGESGST